jgi:pimeloyl-ACP methyl ester carboxylesterase
MKLGAGLDRKPIMLSRMKAIAALLLLASAGAAAADTASFLAPCDIPGVKEKAKCGTYTVWENRETKAGRRIGLYVVVLPATGSPREPDAITYLAGGPGDAATKSASYFAQLFAGLRQHRDVLLVDQRGTGQSHPLECDLYPGKDAQTALGAFYPAERVRECRASLAKIADLGMYTSAPAMDDLDEIRGALGYRSLDLYGGSYGTRAAQVFLQRHPDHARVAVMAGIVPTFKPMPLHFPRYAQHAIDQVFADCAAEASCRAAFPDLPDELRAIIARTAAKPVPVDIVNPKTGEPVHVLLSRDLVGEALRYLMYDSASALYIPVLVHQAAGGDFGPLAEFALGTRQQLVNGLGQGLYLSVTCAEDLPFIDPAEAAREAANTFLGDYRYRQQRAACDAWTRGPIPAHLREPVRAKTPALLISGTWDPVTPAGDATEVASTLPNSVSLLIPTGGHDYEGIPGAEECVAAMISRFVERGSTAGLDTSCVAGLKHPPFPLKPLDSKPVELSAEQQRALVGHYTSEQAPPVEIAVEHGKLVAHVGNRQQFILAAVSPSRVRLLGDIGSYVDFGIENGKAVRMTLERGGTAELSWTRSD